MRDVVKANAAGAVNIRAAVASVHFQQCLAEKARVMKLVRKTPFLWLMLTGVVASFALIIEAGLPVSRDIHFLLEFLWVGVVSAALLASVMIPMLSNPTVTTFPATRDAVPIPELRAPAVGEITEWYDEDRLWLQGHVGSELTQD